MAWRACSVCGRRTACDLSLKIVYIISVIGSYYLGVTEARHHMYIHKSDILNWQVGWRIKFEFDSANLDHIAAHNVSRREIHQLFRSAHVIIPANLVGGEPRWKAFGKTAKGRYLTVVFAIRKGRVRPVTAHTMNREDRRVYGPEIDARV